VDFKVNKDTKKKTAPLPINKNMIHFIKIKGSDDQDELILAIPNPVKIQQANKKLKKLCCLIICLLLILLVLISIGISLILIQSKIKPNSSKTSLF
jgi:hypothetical protein